MALSDEDRAAIREVREWMETSQAVPPATWERVLRLAGEVPPEPADLTFWYDPNEPNVWMRNDNATLMVHGPNDLNRWWCTGDDRNFSWDHVSGDALHLVELVPADTTAAKARTILHELASAWQAWHRNACGRRETLANCEYHECVHRYQALLAYGLEEDWEE